MLSAKEVILFYETLLANTWMEEMVKIDLRLSRKHVLALSRVIELGLAPEHLASDGLLQATIKDSQDTLLAIPGEIRNKGNLTEMSEKMNVLVAM